MTGRTLLVAETFGPTIQGEGPSSGKPAAFLRLSRCNLRCVWCDTPYTWDVTRFDLRRESSWRDVIEVGDELLAIDTQLVVITGGEPLLQQAPLIPLVHRLLMAGRRVEVETNGTVVPLPDLTIEGVTFNVSPKLANAHLPEHTRIVPEALRAFAASGRAVFKFVVTCASDLDQVERLATRHALTPIVVMPEGTTPDAVLAVTRDIADDVVARGWSLSQRLHVLLWGDQRGR